MSLPTSSINGGRLEQLIEELSQLPTYTIGRGTTNRIVISTNKISGHHARLIACTPTSFVLEDLGSKNGTFVNGTRIIRKIVDQRDTVRLAETEYTIDELLSLLSTTDTGQNKQPDQDKPEPPTVKPPTEPDKPNLDFTREFADLKLVYEQYPKLRKNCRDREKMIRTGSVIISSIVGISAVLTTGGGALPLLQIMSGAGLSMLVPTLCSALLSTDEKLEVIDKEYRQRYRCPNAACRDPFGTREWELLAQQKTCRRCQAVWVE